MAAPEALRWEHWDEESVLFDRRSGQTHLLTALTAECLLLLQDAELDLDQLTAALGEQFQLAPEQAAVEQIHQLLLALLELSLITKRQE
jgi:PqqD family protein of HPr-rel-A system